MPAGSSQRPPLIPRWGWWIPFGLFAVLFLAAAGIGGLLIAIGVIAFIFGAYTVIFGRRGALNLPSRAWGTGVVIASIALTAIGGPLANTGSDDETPIASSTQKPSVAPVTPAEPTATVSPRATATPTATPTSTATAERVEDPQHSVEGSALALLATLPVKGSAPANTYDRVGQFGTAWIDVDGNGCDTRNDILRRDLTNIALDGSCTVLSGDFADPYTGTQIRFERGVETSRLVQIDHLVALKDAWRTGAQQLDQGRRVALANDPLNLMASDGSANASKGDRNAASWLPANRAFRCEYVARQVSVKAAYGLWVVPAEHDAIERILQDCPDQPAYAAGSLPAPVHLPAEEDPAPREEAPAPAPQEQAPAPAPAPQEPAPAPAPAPDPVEPPAPEPVPDSVYYKNCDAARAAGAAPVRVGDPGYARHLDRDGDGIGCE